MHRNFKVIDMLEAAVFRFVDHGIIVRRLAYIHVVVVRRGATAGCSGRRKRAIPWFVGARWCPAIFSCLRSICTLSGRWVCRLSVCLPCRCSCFEDLLFCTGSNVRACVPENWIRNIFLEQRRCFPERFQLCPRLSKYRVLAPLRLPIRAASVSFWQCR